MRDAANALKERIWSYLQSRSDPVSAKELVQVALKIQQANDKLCQALMANLLKEDWRFICDAQGHWRISSVDVPGASDPLPIAQALFTAVEMATTPTDVRPAEILAIAAVRLEGYRQRDRYLGLLRPSGGPTARLPDLFDAGDACTGTKWDLLRGFVQFLGPAIWLGFDPKKNLALLNRELENQLALRIDPPFVSLREVARRLFPDVSFNTLAELAAYLGIKSLDTENPKLRLEVLTEAAFTLFELLEELSLVSVCDLFGLQEAKPAPTDFSQCNFDWRALAELPTQPGVYFFKDRRGDILYVGKAKNLKNRVSSYFSNYAILNEKIQQLRASVYDIAYQVAGSELEALILEAQLIQELRPPINSQIEVHARAATRTKSHNLILVMPSSSPEHVELFLIRKNKALARFRLSRSLSNLKAARRTIQKVFFSDQPRRIKKADAWQIEILASWLERNKDTTNRIDVDAVADLDDCLRILTRYVREGAIGLERVIHQ
jgi:DNA polymerase III epsilon subunit-like protein